MALRRHRKSRWGTILNGTHQLLVCVDDVNLLGDNTDTIKNNMEAVIDVSTVVGLEVNAEKIKYIYVVVSSPECRAKS
jgi:hypothetical protein